MKNKTLKGIVYSIGTLGVLTSIYLYLNQYPQRIEELVYNAPIITTEMSNSPDKFIWGFYAREEPIIKIEPPINLLGIGLEISAQSQFTWDLYQKRFNELNKEKSLDGTVKVPDLDRDGKVGLEDK